MAPREGHGHPVIPPFAPDTTQRLFLRPVSWAYPSRAAVVDSRMARKG